MFDITFTSKQWKWQWFVVDDVEISITGWYQYSSMFRCQQFDYYELRLQVLVRKTSTREWWERPEEEYE